MLLIISSFCVIFFFFFNDTATTEIYTLSLHDALPIYGVAGGLRAADLADRLARDRQAERSLGDPLGRGRGGRQRGRQDRKSTRLNSSHSQISYAVFCLKKKKKNKKKENKHKLEVQTQA